MLKEDSLKGAPRACTNCCAPGRTITAATEAHLKDIQLRDEIRYSGC
jgi:hypothetical protein